MKSSLQWERRQQWWGRIYSSNSPKGQKFVVTRKKVNESAAFWTLAGIKQQHLGVCPTSAYFGEVETTQDVPFAFGMHLDLKQSSIGDRSREKREKRDRFDSKQVEDTYFGILSRARHTARL